MRSVGNAATQQVLRLLAGDTRLCLPLDCVNKILPLMMLEAVPKSPPFIVGLMNLAGRSVTVVDLAVRLGLERHKTYSLDTPIILCSHGDTELALLADQVIGLADVSVNHLQTAGRFKQAQSPFLGSLLFEKEIFLLLNLDKLFDLNSSPVAENAILESEHE